MKKVDALLDDVPPQLDDAIPLLRQVLEVEPERLMALHSLSWSLDASRRTDPLRWERELKAEHWRLRDQVLSLTKGTKPGGTLSDAQRARTLALSLWAEDVVRGNPTQAQLDAVEAALDEAEALRELPDLSRGRRGLEAWRAVRQGVKGYPSLLDSMAETPARRILDVPDDDAPCFGGLEGAFSDEGFLAWLRKRTPAARPKGKKGKELDAAVLLAAGEDSAPFFGPGFGGFGRVGRVLALRALGANLDVRNDSKQGLLHLAAMVDDAALVKELLSLGLSPAAVDEEKATPLHRAIENDAVACVPVLVNGGAAIEALDENGRTPLFDARVPLSAQALLDAGANPNGGEGWTVLHQLACFMDRGPVIEVLLRAGADASRKDAQGKTPADEALERELSHIASLLGATPNAKPASRRKAKTR
ncbi:ankyrin repeat domain-containing protein [Myxococcus landrumensis]|uniref:Ankyrin repeat domain-containing protein n=2 Tax=Myxococcus landrumensis TaxID=2813577 RepID=A0ABX7NKS5_9BACT|nr:ankyrin repeat domain-containing protein [Myxococcus landrumus]